MLKPAFWLLAFGAQSALAATSIMDGVSVSAPVNIVEFSWVKLYKLDVPQLRALVPTEARVISEKGAKRPRDPQVAAPIRLETPDVPPPTTLGESFCYTLKLKNLNDVPIRSVVWDYVFLDSPSGAEIGRIRFDTPITIKPGNEKKLQGFTFVPPTYVVSVAALQKGGRIASAESIEIVQIRFSDQSVWQADDERIKRVHPLIGMVVPPGFGRY